MSNAAIFDRVASGHLLLPATVIHRRAGLRRNSRRAAMFGLASRPASF
jgi:hypothetical protein